MELTKEQENKIFYNSQPIFSYKRLYNLICHLRGKGKTYHFTKKCIEVGLEQKKISFVILVRYKIDIDDIKDAWWTIVEHLFPEYTFYTERKIIYASNGLETFPIGQFVALNQYVKEKKIPRPYVRYIWFDEFLNEERDYLPNEMDAFISICDSIIRNRDNCRVILTSNTISMLNPYFNYFGITALNGQFTKGLHNSIVEFIGKDDAFIEFRKNTTFGKTIDGTDYGAFALEGRFMLDDTTDVYPNPQGARKYYYSIVLNGMRISVFLVNGLLFFTNNNDTTKESYTPYLVDAKVNGAYFVKKDFRYFEQIKDKMLRDEVMFQTLPIKNEIIKLVKWMMGVSYESR